MPLVNVLLALIIFAISLWLINDYIPMESSLKLMLNAVVVICVGVWILKVAGAWGPA